MARLEIEIVAVNAELKRVLRESKVELTNFAKGLNFKPAGIDNINTALAKTKQLLKDISVLSNNASRGLNMSGSAGSNTSDLQRERLALAQSRTAAQEYRTEQARLRTEMAAVRAQTVQNRTATIAAAGSYREAQQTLTALGRSIRESAGGFNSTNPAIRAQITQYRELNERLSAFDATMGNHQRNVGNYKTALGGLSRTLISLAAGAFSVGAITNFGREVIKITAEFQKFGAVLSNTLGSEALSDLKLQEIQAFAEKTPFAVAELTSAFVKLANSGFKPTGDEMRSLGDLAASTGKTFDQLAEAVLDAQTGEFERLKEFGIRAKDAGDSVIFTYRGVQTQVEKTSVAIRDYITNLGNAEGVSGSMAKISQTLGGQISNLGDTWDKMLLSVGSNTSGVFNKAIKAISGALTKIIQYNEELEIASNYNLGNKTVDFFQQINRALNPFSSKGATKIELSTSGIKEARKDVSNFVSEAIAAANSTDDFGRALADLKIQGDKALKSAGIQSEEERRGISDAYQKGVKAIIDARRNFDKELVVGGGNFGRTTKEVKNTTVAVKELVTELNKINTNTLGASAPSFTKPKPADIGITGAVSIPDIASQTDLAYAQLLEKQAEFNQAFNQLAESGISQTLGNIGASIAEALANGGDVLGAVGSELLNGFSQFLDDYGDLLIKYGAAAVLKGKLDLAALVPGAGIAAGLAAIAAGVALKAASAAINAKQSGKSDSGGSKPVSRFANGAVLSGPTIGLMAEYPGASSNPEVVSPLDKLNSMISKNIRNTLAMGLGTGSGYTGAVKRVGSVGGSGRVTGRTSETIILGLDAKLEGSVIRLAVKRADEIAKRGG